MRGIPPRTAPTAPGVAVWAHRPGRAPGTAGAAGAEGDARGR